MAEVEKGSAAATTTTSDAVAVSELPLDDIGEAAGNSTAEYGTSPTQERSSASHPHDSEYDTASDLEGDEGDYEDDDDDLDEDSITDGESMTDDDDLEDDDDDGGIDDDDDSREANSSLERERAEIEAQKKVDEDRSNPQYIPKRGTFYEHDDRTAEGESDRPINLDDIGDKPDDGSVSVSGVKPTQSPNISQASKTMKKWQPASAVERWSHDRFDPSEQAPKSRAELVNAYGYDIRTEDAPPRARRRRRYGRGPNKYSRNWEDESAYLKASNRERKLPRASEFPSLNERHARKTCKAHVTREEKENRVDKRSNNTSRSGQLQEDRRDMKGNNNNNKGKNYNNNQSGGYNNGRQAPMEFKQKHRNTRLGGISTYKDTHNRYDRNDANYDRQYNRHQSNGQQQQGMSDYTQRNTGNGGGNDKMTPTYSKLSQRLDNAYGGGSMNNQNAANQQHHNSNSYQQKSFASQNQPPNNHLQQQHQQHQQAAASMRQQQGHNFKNTSNLSQRLQQAQNRNDPSHVGSVQMHSLATQNQLVNQQQQQQLSGTNMIMNTNSQQGSHPANAAMQQQQQLVHQQDQHQRAPPKRYSSLRRTHQQHDGAHQLSEQMQQMHLQQQQTTPPSMLLQDQQHVLQTNLMQLYHPDNLQAMQVIQPTNPNASQTQKSSTGYATLPTQQQTQQAAAPYNNPTSIAAANPSASTFFVAPPPDVYTSSASASAATNPQVPGPPGPFTSQPTPNYLPSSSATAVSAAASLAYAGGPTAATQPPPPQVSAAAPPTAAFGSSAAGPSSVAAVTAAGPTTTQTNKNFTNYQNYNTVGGTTYFVPPVQATTRPAALPQRRPTNAIPILPPSEKNKQRNHADDGKTSTTGANSSTTPQSQHGRGPQSAAPIGSAENIDHILDNMFVQRPIIQPSLATAATSSANNNNLTRKSSSPPSLHADNNASSGGGGENTGSSFSSGIGPTISDAVADGDKTSSNIGGSGGGGGENAQLEKNNVNNSITLAKE